MTKEMLLKKRQMAKAENNTDATPEHAEYILMDTAWNQASYSDNEFEYNKYCPYIMNGTKPGSERSYTGCVSTMAGQIVYYWIQKKGFDLDLTLSSDDSYTTSYGVVISTTQDSKYGYLNFYEVNNMLADFTIGSNHNGDNDDIAALCFALGVKGKSDYGDPTGTAASIDFSESFKSAGFASANCIDCDNHQYFYTYDFYSDEAPSLTSEGWGILVDQLQNELVVGCMIYTGEAEQHAIAVDGYYAPEGLIHLNFGWGNSGKTWVEEEQRYAGNGWYTRAEFESLRPSYYLVDLRGVYAGTAFRVENNKTYGVGALNRVVEQVNGLVEAGEIKFATSSAINYNASVFDITNSLQIRDFNTKLTVNDAAGASLFRNRQQDSDFIFNGTLGGSMNVSGAERAVAVEARNISVDTRMQTSAAVAAGTGDAYAWKASGSLNVEEMADNAIWAVSSEDAVATVFSAQKLQGAFSGVLVANSADSAAAVFMVDSGSDAGAEITVSNAAIFAGSYRQNSQTYAAAAQIVVDALSAPASKLDSNMVDAAAGYVFYGAAGDDVFSVGSGSLLLGDVAMGEGANTLNIAGDSYLYGDISGENLEVVFNLDQAASLPVLTVGNLDALLADTTTYTINIAPGASGKYTLIKSADDFSSFNDKSFAVMYNNSLYTVGVSDSFATYSFIDIAVENDMLTVDVKANNGLEFVLSNDQLTNQDVILYVTSPDSYQQISYSLDNGSTFQDYTDSGIVIQENCDVQFKLFANDGTVGEASYTVDNIDKTPPAAPVITPSTTTITRDDVVLTVEFAEDAVVREFSRDGHIWRTMPGSKVSVSENSTLFFRCFDKAGNESGSKYTVDNIEGSGPIRPVVTLSEYAPTRDNVLVSAEFAVYSISNSYSFDGMLWRPYRGAVEMTENGDIYFRSVDEFGDVATVKVVVDNIDRTAPLSPRITQQYFNQQQPMVLVQAEFADDSQLNEVSYDHGATYERYTGSIECYWNQVLYFRSTDAAGNVSQICAANVIGLPALAVQKQAFLTGNFAGGNQDMLAVADKGKVDIYQNDKLWAFADMPEGWEVVGAGDFNADGQADLLKKYVDGVVIAENSNGDGTFTSQVLNIAAYGWQMNGVGDFNGDGAADILLTSPTSPAEPIGLLGYWANGTDWTLIDGYSSEWQITGVGDYNGDGVSDMLWKKSILGQDGKTVEAYCSWIVGDSNNWRMVSSADPEEWDYLASGDFNGDSVCDVAMIRNDGLIGIWGMADGTQASWSVIGQVNTAVWTLAGVGDFNGDGTDDIAWSCDNQTGYWQVEDYERKAWHNIIAAAK